MTSQPYLAWYDARASSWEVPVGAGSLGELPFDPTCEADRAVLSARWPGAGLVAAYSESSTRSIVPNPTLAMVRVR